MNFVLLFRQTNILRKLEIQQYWNGDVKSFLTCLFLKRGTCLAFREEVKYNAVAEQEAT